MRTKALLCAAALVAGIASSWAQSNVYSLNVVGYYNVPVTANVSLYIANQLNTTNNTIGSLLPGGPAGAVLQKLTTTFAPYVFDDLDMVWTPDGLATLNPGEAALFKSPSAATLTFVGEVLQGCLTNTLVDPLTGNKIVVLRSSMVPQAGGAAAVLGLQGEGGDILQLLHGSMQPYVFDDLDMVWTPSDPVITVGEGFWYKKSPAATGSLWTRCFTVL